MFCCRPTGTPPEAVMFEDLEQQYKFTKNSEDVVDRIYTVGPRKSKRYYLLILLLHFSGATSFQDMPKFEGNIYPTYRETFVRCGLFLTTRSGNVR